MKKLKILLLLVLGYFLPFIWGGLFLWWFFTRTVKNLTWGKIYLFLIGNFALIALPAGALIDHFFHTEIQNEYLWPAFTLFIGLSTLCCLAAACFCPPLVTVYDEYKPDVYRNGHKINY